ncbi:MAG: hypothetical protein ABI432_18805 [Flavobacteriales bacterium]
MENARTPGLVALLLMVFSTAGSGCRKEAKPQWDVDLLAPLVITSFTIRDVLPDSDLITGSQGALTLLFRSDLFVLDLDTLLSAPDTSFVYSYALPTPGPLNFPAGTNFFGENDVTRFDLQDLELSRLDLREGTLELSLKNMVASTVIGTVDLPGVTFATGTSAMNASVGPGTPANPALASASRDLAGSVFDLRGPDFNSVNTLTTSISAQLDQNGAGATVTDQDSLIATVSYNGLVPQYAKGYFGSRTVHVGPEVSNLGLFNNVVGGSIDLDQVALRMRLENGFGADVRVAIRYLTALNSTTGNSVDLMHSIIPGPINLNRALDLGFGFTPSVYENELDNTDSNLDLFLENLPDQLSYELDVHLNPLGDISNGNDFLYFESKLKASLELEIPLRLIANDLTLQNILTPELPGTAEAHGLQSGKLMLFATNGFPFDARLELDIVDADGQVLSSLPVTGSIASGVLGVNALVQYATESRMETDLTAEQVDLLYAGGRLRTRVAFTTIDQTQHLRILDSYKLDLQITAAANYIVNGNE